MLNSSYLLAAYLFQPLTNHFPLFSMWQDEPSFDRMGVCTDNHVDDDLNSYWLQSKTSWWLMIAIN